MKIKRNSSVFENSSRRPSLRLPVLPIVVVVAIVGLLALIWSRGGEQVQRPVEKPIPAERLGK
jgi:hypothetical protein